MCAVAASFAALEVPALRRRAPGEVSVDTLTYFTRGVLGTRDRRRRRWICGPLFVAGCAWVAGHMVAGWWNS
jgi:hypothetical protein